MFDSDWLNKIHLFDHTRQNKYLLFGYTGSNNNFLVTLVWLNRSTCFGLDCPNTIRKLSKFPKKFFCFQPLIQQQTTGKYPIICLTPSLEAYPNCLYTDASTPAPQAYDETKPSLQTVSGMIWKLSFHSYH